MPERETQSTALAILRHDVDYIKKKLDGGNGNGLGIVKRLEEIEKLLKDHLLVSELEKDQLKKDTESSEEREKARRDFWLKVFLLAIGMIISNIGVIIFSFLER